MNREKITNLLNSAASLINDQETFVLPVLAAKLRRAAETYPQDRTILGVADILATAETNKKILISRGEIKELYKRLYTNHTRFAEVCQEELGQLPQLATAKIATKHEKQDVPLDLYAGVDQTLANALNGAFEKKVSYHLFSRDSAERAKFAVNMGLEACNLKASKLNVPSGNEHFLVVQADYQTPKGTTSILIPVEAAKGQAYIPEVFMGNEGPVEFTHANLKQYISTHAGVKLAVRSADVVAALTNSIAKKAEVSSVEKAMTKIAAAKEAPVTYFGDAVLGQKVAEVGKADLKVAKSGQFESFAEKLKTPLGYANLKFGTEKVNLGRDVVARTMTSFGIKNAQINLAATDENTISYAVSINDGRVAFTVPVKFANNRVINPEVLVCNGSVKTLSKGSIQGLFAANEKDYKAAAACSPQYGLKADELIANVRNAMAEDNYSKAEDALNVLASSGNVKAYQAAFAVYTSGLAGMTKTAAKEETGCTMVRTASNSEHPICGHTNLPVHKVYQDKYGHCHPLYRRAQSENESFEVPSIIASKAFSQ